MSLPVREQVENPENLRETRLKTRPVMKSGYFDLLHSRDIWLFSTAIALAVAWPWVTEPALGQPMTQDGPPVHFRLDRNYYTIETNARVRVEPRLAVSRRVRGAQPKCDGCCLSKLCPGVDGPLEGS